ncbi:MAG: hypothetical protein WDA24_07635 [Tissierellales bacterium]
MSQTRKAVIFFLSFFIALVLVSLLFQIISPLIANMDQGTIFNIISPLFTTIGLLLFILLQALIRYMFYKKLLTSDVSLVSANITKFGLKERLLPYTILMFIHLPAFLGQIVLNYTFIIRILMIIGSIIIIELLLRITNQNTRVYLRNNDILITGFDGRSEIPFGVSININNDSGFYRYKDIENYKVLPNHIELKIVNGYGKITFIANEEMTKQATELMKEKEVPVRE